MNPIFPSRLRRLCLAGLCGLILQGCVAYHHMQEKPGTDLRRIKPGITKTEVDEILGPPIRDWHPNDRITYQLYRYRRTSINRDGAATVLLLDVVSAGFAEVVLALAKEPDGSDAFSKRASVGRLWLSFDSANRLLGVFPEMAELPGDGLSPAGTTAH